VAKTKIPNPLEQRHLLVKELPEAQARELAEAYLEAGRRTEAIEFFAKASAREDLQRLRDEAIEAGDAFLMKMISEKLETEPSAEDWQRLGAAAEAAGKERYVGVAARQAGVAEV